MPTDIEPVDAFRYPGRALVRRHGPASYADYRSYRPWLRDDFAFGCVYCLIREQWGRATGEFELDDFIPQVHSPDEEVEYENLLYSCRTCNLRKGRGAIPDPGRVLTAETTRVYPDGSLVGLTAEAETIIRFLCLNSPSCKRWRRTWIRIVELAAENDEKLLRKLLGFPDDLPNLKLSRAPRNTRPEGVRDSFFARRERGELPELNLG